MNNNPLTPETAPQYRPCVGIMLMNEDKKVLVGQRRDNAGDAWQMPQGGIDPGESPMQAAFRELEEEVGTAQASIIAESPEWLTYDLPDDLASVFWGGKYRGQIQRWFLMRLLVGEDALTVHTSDPEFRALSWVEPATLPEIIVPFKRSVYEAVLSTFSTYLDP